MKALVGYDTKFGNTGKVAQAIAAALGPEVRAAKVDTVKPEDLTGLDLLIIGSPTRAWSASKTTKRIERALRRQGCTIVAPAIRLFVVKGAEGPLLEGELERATAWAREIGQGLEH